MKSYRDSKLELIEAIGYMAKDLAAEAEDLDIREDWKRLQAAGVITEALTDEDIETLREYST